MTESHILKDFLKVSLDFDDISLFQYVKLLVSEFQNLAELRVIFLKVSEILPQDLVITTFAWLLLHCGLGFLNYLQYIELNYVIED